jgi:putative spermidine/putrescine transport system permease protein
VTEAVAAPQRQGLSGWMRARGYTRTAWLVLPGVVFMVAFFIYPVLYGVSLSFQGQAGGISAYTDFFADTFPHDSGSFESLGTTLWLSLPSGVISVLLAMPLAWRLRNGVRGLRALTAVIMVPMTLGSVFVAEALNNLLGPTGWVNRTLLALHLVSAPLQLTGNAAGVEIALVLTGLPFAFLLMLGYASGIDPQLDRAASVLGAGPTQRFLRIDLPLLLPGITITFALSFVLAFAVFPSATLLGNDAGPTRVLSKVAYTEYSNANYANASATAVVMAVTQLVVLGAVLLVRSRLYRGSSSGGKG